MLRRDSASMLRRHRQTLLLQHASKLHTYITATEHKQNLTEKSGLSSTVVDLLEISRLLSVELHDLVEGVGVPSRLFFEPPDYYPPCSGVYYISAHHLRIGES